MIIIMGGIALKPETREAATALAAEHSARSRGEPGCIAHNCHLDVEDERRLVFVEMWQDMEAVRTHFAVPESGRFVQALAALGEGAPWMRVYDAREMNAVRLD